MNRSLFLTNLITFTTLMSCRMQAPDSEYNNIVTVNDGVSLQLETYQEQAIVFNYKHEFNAENVAPEIVIKEKPKYGILTECTTSDDFVLSCTYTPNKGFSGTDQISIVGKDGSFESDNAALVNIKVKKRGPELNTITNQSITETQSINKIDLNDSGDDLDVNGFEINYKCFVEKNSDSSIACNNQYGINFDSNSGVITWATDYDSEGLYTFSVSATSDTITVDKSFTIEVKNKNRAPVLNSISNQTINKGESISQININDGEDDLDVDGDAISYSCIVNNVNCTSLTGVSFNTSSGVLDFNSSSAVQEKYTFKITGSDGELSSNVTFDVNVVLNYPPVANSIQTIDLYKGESVTFDLIKATDDKTLEASLNYTVKTQTSQGTLSSCITSDRKCTYKAKDNYVGSDFFEYIVNDGENNSNTAKVIFNIKDKGPKLDTIANINIQETSIISTIDANDGGDDLDMNGNAISYTCQMSANGGSQAICSNKSGVSFNGTTGKLNWTTGYDDAGVYAVTITGTSHGLSSQTSFQITINNKNRAPSLDQVADYNIFRGESISAIDINDSGDDKDIDGDSLTYSCLVNNSVCLSSTGISFNTSNGQMTIDSSLLKVGANIFKITGSDGSLSAQMVFTVNLEENYAPVAGDNQTESLFVNTQISFQVNAASDDRTLTGNLVYEIVKNVSNGTISDCFVSAGNRNCIYSPNQDFIGQDNFTYKVKDEQGLYSEVKTVTLIVSQDTLFAEEIFEQNASTKLKGVDIVWVIDDSGSMSDEQATLANNFDSFINYFIGQESKLDFRMAITTTDARERNEVFGADSNGNQWELDLNAAINNEAKFKSDFKSAVNVGINGSGSEKAFDSAHYMYSKTPTWFRNNDYLLVFILLTDEKEQSTLTSVENADLFKSYKDHPEKVKLYPIVNLNADHARFDGIATEMGSKVYDIYSPFNEVLNNLGTTIANLLDSFILKADRQIVASSVKVYVNDVEIPKTDSNGNVLWKYEYSTINFTTSPAEGSKIRVTYDYKIN